MIASRTSGIVEAEFDLMNRLAARLRGEGHHIVNLGQGLPPFGPPPIAVEAFAAALAKPEMHRYSGNAGLLVLREALSAQLKRHEGIDVEPDEIIITSGGNQAFMVALIATVDAGQDVLLPSPYFVNHEMAVRAVGARPIEVPTRAAEGFRVTWADIEAHLTPATRAVILCTPSNPTGAQIAADEMATIVDQLAARQITVIADETYMHFTHADDEPGQAHASAAAGPDWRRNVVLTSSFSKSFGVTGWRVGYLAADRALVDQAMKIHDTMVICATSPAQAGIAAAVEHDWHYAKRSAGLLAERRAVIAAAIADSPGLSWTLTRGSFFAFVKVDTDGDARDISTMLLERAHVVTIPGAAFGEAGRGYLRISYGLAGVDELREGIERITWCLRRERAVGHRFSGASAGDAPRHP